MRGIQIMYVSPSGDTRDSDDLVKDLEHWFEDHKQMCRLVSTSVPQHMTDVAHSLERLTSSADHGQRLLLRLKKVVQDPNLRGLEAPAKNAGGRIPLSGGNRFVDPGSTVQVLPGTTGVGGNSSGAGAAAVSSHQVSAPTTQTTFMAITNVSNTESPSILPSRTYLKKR